ncbi:MAG: helix-turn-helix domain-containing protein [Planctomycetota bacterium]
MEPGTPPFQVHNVGRVQGAPRHVTPGTRQGDIMLYAVLSGRGQHRSPTSDILLEGGMVGLVPPEQAGFTMADPEDPYDHWFCRFNGSYAPALARSIVIERGARFFHDSNTATIAGLLERMRPGFRAQLPQRMGMSEILLAEALILLQDRQPARRPRGLEPFVVLDWLQDRLDQPFDLEEMATSFGMTRQGLGRAVRRICGASPLVLLERLRLDLACELLASDLLPVTEIALRVGYEDPSYFARVFRKHLGTSPKAWQRARRAGSA